MFPSEHTALAINALLTPRDTKEIDKAARGLLKHLMENAALMVARVIRQQMKPCRVLVACGPGNNGGDGYRVARYLHEWGWSVVVASWKEPQPRSLAQYMAQQWEGPTVPFLPEEAQRVDLVVDAVFGAGATRSLPLDIENFFRHARACVAIDLPSGVDGESGFLYGEVIENILTVALVRKRPAHLLQPSSQKCGKIVCVDIGMPQTFYEYIKVRFWENTPNLWEIPQQNIKDHKYTRGIVGVCGGSRMPGAAYLASESARRSGAGLVKISTTPDTASFYREASKGVIVDSDGLTQTLKDKRCRVWVCGPGLTCDEVHHVIPHLFQEKCYVIADAGVFSWAQGQPKKLKGVTIMTPHIGEFERVFGCIKISRIDSVRKAAEQSGSVIVLKGADTLIAAPDGRISINVHATPALATAGSGDVLSGIVAMFLAAGMPAWEASCAGVWLHGEAGRAAVHDHGPWIVAEDLLHFVGKSRQLAGLSKA